MYMEYELTILTMSVIVAMPSARLTVSPTPPRLPLDARYFVGWKVEPIGHFFRSEEVRQSQYDSLCIRVELWGHITCRRLDV